MPRSALPPSQRARTFISARSRLSEAQAHSPQAWSRLSPRLEHLEAEVTDLLDDLPLGVLWQLIEDGRHRLGQLGHHLPHGLHGVGDAFARALDHDFGDFPRGPMLLVLVPGVLLPLEAHDGSLSQNNAVCTCSRAGATRSMSSSRPRPE